MHRQIVPYENSVNLRDVSYEKNSIKDKSPLLGKIQCESQLQKLFFIQLVFMQAC